MAQLGCAVEMHVKSAQREVFPLHLVAGLYIRTSQENYICHKVWVKDNKSARIGDTVFFKHTHLKKLTITTANAIIQSTNNL